MTSWWDRRRSDARAEPSGNARSRRRAIGRRMSGVRASDRQALRGRLESLEQRALLTTLAIGPDGDTRWADAVEIGQVDPVDPFAGERITQVARQFYQSHDQPFGLTSTRVDPDRSIELEGETRDGLVARWRTEAAVAGLSVSAWDLNFLSATTDLGNSRVTFDVGVPAAILPDSQFGRAALWSVSLQMIDATGNSRGWFATDLEPGWSHFELDLGGLHSQQNFTYAETDLFDPSRVSRLRFESASFSTTLANAPADAVDDELTSWAVWHQVTVAAESGAEIHGTHFEDLNGDGIRGPLEPGLPGWSVLLTGETDAGESITREVESRYDDPDTPSNESGRFVFENLPAGSYRLVEAHGAVPDGEGGELVPSTGDRAITVDSTSVVRNVDFGHYLPATVEGAAWHDLNGDGIWQGDEPPLTDIIILEGTDGLGRQVQRQATTDPVTGGYAFPNLAPGRYTLRGHTSAIRTTASEDTTEVIVRSGRPSPSRLWLDRDQLGRWYDLF